MHSVAFPGIVSQEPNLLNDTITNNIAFGNKYATHEMIVEAAKQANAHDFIIDFPDGYNTVAGNRGAQLSGTCPSGNTITSSSTGSKSLAFGNSRVNIFCCKYKI